MRLLALVFALVGLAGCATAPQSSDPPDTRIDRAAVRAELTYWLDQAEILAEEAGDPEAARKIHNAREVGRQLLAMIDTNQGDVSLNVTARELDRLALAAIGAIPSTEKRMAARLGYMLVRGVMVRRGVGLPAPELVEAVEE